MAFLCPSRRGRQKKKHKEPKAPFLGRITGSSSIDTLVRVGLEKQHGLTPDARMCVTQDFLATTPGELSARCGDHVYRLYLEGDWVYVITELGQEGFIPSICLTAINDVTHKHKSKNECNDVMERLNINDNPGFEKTVHGHKESPKEGGAYQSTNSARYNVRSAEREKGVNVSMLADEGSDVSSTHSATSLRHRINPLPKPARNQNIPDVISTTSDSVNLDKQSVIIDKSNATPHIDNKSKTQNKKRHEKIDTGDKPYYDTTRQTSSNVLELPDRKAGTRDSHTSNGDSITEVKTFVKKVGRKIVVLFSFNAPDENDLCVQKGEIVTVLNEKDSDWIWAKTKNGNEGFVPKCFTSSIPNDLLKMDEGSEIKSEAAVSIKPHSKMSKSRASSHHDVRELRTLRNFEAQSTDDISVLSGEQVFVDLANQIEEDWLWVYTPATQSYGYIPKDNVRWPSDVARKTATLSSSSSIENVKLNNSGGKPV